MKKLFLIIGAPGSGKTTDASMIAANDAKFAHYSTGDLLRAEVASGSELGKLIDSFISKGNLVPLEVVVNAIISAIRSSDKNYILIDGYPRSLEQMRELDRVLASQSEVILDGVIEVDVSEEVARNRVLGRARGADDNNEVFNNRMKVYLDPIKEIRAFYNDKKLLHKVNGERTIETIVADMKNLIENLIKG
ncbi:adenylate kinase [Campylobacter fetus subsp. testudinum]|uniref:adenylate kinase n=1 Tax=Campylobacter fetus TaxID=196 RepID=UPI0008187A90|nr:adenylate kinase [Campylobacter fetus]OCS01163.1 adenylate kinase [Campylobacter fetus subsp. testudinum]